MATNRRGSPVGHGKGSPASVQLLHPDEIYTPDQLEKMLHLQKPRIWREIREGRLKASKIGRLYRVRGRHVCDYLEANTVSS